MIDHEKLQAIRSGMAVKDKDPLKSMSERELRSLRAEIDGLLPRASLDGLNLEMELVEQLHTIKGLQAEVLTDPDVPANQRSQCAMAVANTISKLIDMQVDLQRDERLKRIEAALLEAIKLLPDDVKGWFFAEYERIAESKGATA